jgi:hypothetical protein
MIIKEEIKRYGETIWYVAPDWDLVKSWNNEYKGTPGIPNEFLYVCYTDQSKVFNGNIVPTSIVFKNKQDALKIFGFIPEIADFDVKSKMVKKNNVPYFKPSKQVKIEW